MLSCEAKVNGHPCDPHRCGVSGGIRGTAVELIIAHTATGVKSAGWRIDALGVVRLLQIAHNAKVSRHCHSPKQCTVFAEPEQVMQNDIVACAEHML